MRYNVTIVGTITLVLLFLLLSLSFGTSFFIPHPPHQQQRQQQRHQQQIQIQKQQQQQHQQQQLSSSSSSLSFIQKKGRIVGTSSSSSSSSSSSMYVSLRLQQTLKSLQATTTNDDAGTKTSNVQNMEEDLELTRRIVLKYIQQQQEEQEKEDDDDSTSARSTDHEDNNDFIDDSNDRTISRSAVQVQSTTTTPPSTTNHFSLRNDNMIRVALGDCSKKVTPVWLFRQAGRHLPEYHTYKGSKSFLDLLSNPNDVAECTLQPVRRYSNLDAAILFSDILVIVEALNISVTMPGGVGIQIPYPLEHPEDMYERLYSTSMTSNEAKTFVEDKLKHVLDAVSLIRIKMKDENISIPLIGFSAAPWTLLYYMVGGTSKKYQDIGMIWLREYPKESQQLLDLLTTIVIEYVSCQVEHGVHIIQIFEAMGMMISDELFDMYAIPCLERIGTELQNRFNTNDNDKDQIPIMVFTRGACSDRNLQKIASLGCFDVITIDGSVNRSTVRSVIAASNNDVDNDDDTTTTTPGSSSTSSSSSKIITLQGNYDPAELIIENGKTIKTVRESVRTYLKEISPSHLIANLGEGLSGKESPTLVNEFINAVHEISSEMMMKDKKQ